jgi:MFS family permease
VRGGPRDHRATLLVLTVDAGVYSLVQSLVTPALPGIQQSLGVSAGAAAWVITAFLLSASVATPIVGRLGDGFGKRRVLVAILAVMAVGTLAAALSDSLAVLVAARVVQGVAGGVFPLAFGIVRDEFPPERVATGMGWISAVLGIGIAAGTVLSGVIMDGLDYQWLFWLPLGPIVVACVATWLLVPESPVRNASPIGWWAAALLSIGLAAVLLAITQASRWGWGSPRTLLLAAAGLAVLATWILVEVRTRRPLVGIGLMRIRAVWTTNVAGLLLAVGMISTLVLIPQLVELPRSTGFGLGASATEAGLFLLPFAAAMLIIGAIMGPLEARFGSKATLVAGALVSVAGFSLLAAAHTEPAPLYVASALAGAGIGLSFAAMPNLIVAAVPQDQTGVATGMHTVMRWVGAALGSQVVVSVLASSAGADALPADRGFTVAFAITAGALLVAAVVAAAVPGRGRRRAAGPRSVRGRR